MRSNLVHPGDHQSLERLLKYLERAKRRVPRAEELLAELKAADDYRAWLGSRYDVLSRRTDISALISCFSGEAPQVRFITESVTTEKKHRRECSVLLHGKAISHAVVLDKDVEQVVTLVFTDAIESSKSTSGESPLETMNRLQVIGYDLGEVADSNARKELLDALGDRKAVTMTIDGHKLRLRAQSYVFQYEMEAEAKASRKGEMHTLIDEIVPKEFEIDYARGIFRARRKISGQ